jgi:hypothetical protein
MWETRLQKLRQEMGVRTIAKNISAAKVPYTVKVLAYRNGEGRTKQPELVVASSVPGVSFTYLLRTRARIKTSKDGRQSKKKNGRLNLVAGHLIIFQEIH